MKTLEDFKNDVLNGVSDRNDKCPLCWNATIILNSHKCKEGWSIWYDKEKYEERVEMCKRYIKSLKVSDELI